MVDGHVGRYVEVPEGSQQECQQQDAGVGDGKRLQHCDGRLFAVVEAENDERDDIPENPDDGDRAWPARVRTRCGRSASRCCPMTTQRKSGFHVTFISNAIEPEV